MKYFLSFIFLLVTTAGSARPLEKCMSDLSQTTKQCSEKFIKNLTLSTCFTEADALRSNLSKENLKQFCFYEVSEFPTLKSCLSASQKMNIAINHDEAIFECVRQFQDQIDLQLCYKIARKLLYPEKIQHLKRKCDLL